MLVNLQKPGDNRTSNHMRSILGSKLQSGVLHMPVNRTWCDTNMLGNFLCGKPLSNIF